MVHNDYCDRAVNVAKPIRSPRPQLAFQSRDGDWSNPAHAKDERYVPAVILKDRDQHDLLRPCSEVAMQPTAPLTGAPVTYAEILAAVEVTERICSEAFYAHSQARSLRTHSPPCAQAAPANADAGAFEVAAEDSDEKHGGETGFILD